MMVLGGGVSAAPDPSAARVRKLLRTAPREQLRFLIPVEGDAWSAEYLSLVHILDEAGQVGTGDLSLETVLERGQALIGSVTGLAPDEETIQLRLRSLEGWGVLEVSAETGSAISLTRWSASYKRYRITKEGELVMRLLETALARSERRVGMQEAQSTLGEMAAALRDIRSRFDAASANRLPQGSREDVWREGYLQLARVKARDYQGLLEYLRDLNQRILQFGREESPTSDLGALIDRLDAYMAGIHREFQKRGREIAAACHGLFDPDTLESLRLGRALAERREAEDPLATAQFRPEPDVLLGQIIQFFDGDEPGSLVHEVERIAQNCSIIVSRLRDHWQRLLDRTSNVQLLEQAWKRLEALDWHDEAGWRSAAMWNSRIFAVRPIQTAPNLGDETTPGRPPIPGRRRAYVVRQSRDIPVAKATGEPQWKLRRDQELAARLNEFVESRILRGRSEGRTSDLDVEELQHFRSLIDAVQHSTLVLGSAPSYYFRFSVAKGAAAPVSWRTADAAFHAPELVFRAEEPRTVDDLEALLYA